VSDARVAPIVEGHGEVQAIRILLDRVWREVVGGQYLEVLQAVRQPRSKIVKRSPGQSEILIDEAELNRALSFASAKLAARNTPALPGLILLMVDADRDCARELAPRLAQAAQHICPGVSVACVLPVVEYETWFAAAAESLGDYLRSVPERESVEDPESARVGKGWVRRHMIRYQYSETVDQPKLTARMDLELCRRRSPSFDKLCRELARLHQSP
jgi:hypothetical protein